MHALRLRFDGLRLDIGEVPYLWNSRGPGEDDFPLIVVRVAQPGAASQSHGDVLGPCACHCHSQRWTAAVTSF